MKQRWAALLAVAVFSAMAPRVAAAQSSSSGSDAVVKDRVSGSELGQNAPNPFTTETKITFTVGDYPACSDPDRVYRITLRIFNILAQLVAVPVLQGGSGDVADGTPLQNVELPCGKYTAYWDGKSTKSSAEAPPGIYLYNLEVDKRRIARKMLKTKQQQQ
jgi:hypothetical protein